PSRPRTSPPTWPRRISTGLSLAVRAWMRMPSQRSPATNNTCPRLRPLYWPGDERQFGRCAMPLTREGFHPVLILQIVLQVLLGLTSLLLTLLILLHKGRGGGLSDMFGGGVTS